MKDSILLTKSFNFALRIIKLSKYLKNEHQEYVLSKQILRSGTSVGALIREAQYAQSTPDFLHKFTIALKEANETKYWLELLFASGYISENMYNSIEPDAEELLKLLISSTKTVKKMKINNNKFLLPTSYLLPSQKNLLAFSAGIDSTALFFLLIENGIPFDISIVNYGMREQSDEEERYALELADRYGIGCHVAHAPQFESHFECRARKFRYEFFESLIAEHGYDNLLTAHQLNDRLEWMLMRLSKGAGLGEMIGMEEVESRGGYTIVRPLLGYTKDQLLTYLHEKGHKYFVDESNSDEKYERNYFRRHFADPLIEKFGDGIGRSFEYLARDKEIVDSGYEVVRSEKELLIIHLYNPQLKVRAADHTLKRLGYLLSAAQRREIEESDSVVVGGKWAVELSDELLYIAPYIKTTMPKEFKERCRIEKIPPKVRGYLYSEKLEISPSTSSGTN